MTREQKIKLLKDLMTGKINLSEAMPRPLSEYTVWFVNQDGTATNKRTGEKITQEQLEKRHQGKDVITFN